MKKKKLLVFHTKVAPYRVDFFNTLAKQYDMFLCMDRKFVYGGLYSDIEKSYHFDYKEMTSTKGVWAIYKHVKQEIKARNPDVVMVSECGLISMMVILYRMIHKAKYRIVSIIDDSYDQLTEGRQFTKRHEFAEKVMVPRFDQVINVDERVAALFRARYGRGVSFPIIRDENLYRNNLVSAQTIGREYIERYGLIGKRVVLYVGRFVALKNIPTIIKVFKKIGDDNTRLVLVGDGKEKISILPLCEGDSRIILPGPLSGNALYAWYNVASVFVLASYREPFGAVTNEALMAGCRCLISKRAGSSCLIAEGVNGYSFDPLDEEEMADKMHKLLDESQPISFDAGIRSCLMQTTFEVEMNKVLSVI